MTMGFLLPHSPQAVSDPCRIPHQSEQHQSGKTKPRHWVLTGILLFPEKRGGLGSGTGLDPLVQPQKSHPNLSQQSEDISVHHLHPTAPENDLQTTGSRLNLHFTSKKRAKYIHEGRMGWTIIIWKQVSTILTHSSHQCWEQRALQAHTLGLTAGPGLGSQEPLGAEAGWKQWDHTQGECVGHSFWFKWWNAPAGGRSS